VTRAEQFAVPRRPLAALAGLLVLALLWLSPTPALAGPPLGSNFRYGAPPVDDAAATTNANAEAAPPDGLVQPKLKNTVTLEYPAELLAEQPRPEGRVVVKFVVGVDGVPKELEVAASVHPVIDARAMEAVKKLRYEPATYEGNPVEVVLSIALDIAAPEVVPPEPAGTEAPGDDDIYEAPETNDADPSAPVRIAGVLLEAGVRGPVQGADVIAVPPPEGIGVGEIKRQIYEAPEEPAWKVQATTDAEGRFELRGVPNGLVRLIFITTGFDRLEYVVRLNEGEALDVKYFQTRLVDDPYRTTVVSKRDREPEVTRRTITVEEINTLPGTQGDALKAIQNFPGVARAPFGAGILLIRGSAPDDSAVFLGYHEIPLLFHFGGLTSVFNSDILTQIDFIPGNFDSRYGDAIGGVVNVVPRKGRRDGYHGYIDSDIFDTGVLVEGPMKEGSFIISARRSYIDFLLPLVIPADAGLNLTLAPRYWDYQVLFDYPVSEGDLSVRAFGSSDRTVLAFNDNNDSGTDARDRFEQSIRFYRFDLLYEKTIGPWEFLVSPTYLFSKLDVAAVAAFDFDLTFNTVSTRAEMARRLSQRAKIRIGTEFIATQFAIDVTAPAGTGGDNSGGLRFTTVKGLNWIPALYSTATLEATDKLFFYPGVRLTAYSRLETATVDPRLRFVYNILDDTTLKGGVGLYSQAPSPQETDDTFGNPELSPERSLHTSLGIAQGFAHDITFEVTGFYKNLWSLAAPSTRTTTRDDGTLAPEILASTGIGRIYGAEILLRKNLTKNFYAWLSYTISRSETKNTPSDPFIKFTFDQTHILTLIGSYKLPKNWQVGARFRLVSGNPTTPIESGVLDAASGSYRCIQGPINSQRLPLFHQLDLRVDKGWILKRIKIGAYLDVQNAYNRQNSEFRNYSYDCQEFVPITGLPIVPSVGTKIEF